MNIRDVVLDWAATAASTASVFGALCVFDPIQRVAIRLGPKAHQHAVSGMAWAMNRGARFAGTSHRVEGLEHIDWQQNYIIVSNHQSLLDIAMASDFLSRLQPRYVSKIELERGLPGASYNLRRGGSVCIDRKNPEQAIAAIEEMGRRVREHGYSVVIYPEGTRSKNGTMRPFREGGLRALLQHAPGVPVLPVTTWGGSRLFLHNLKPIVRNVELGFRVHAPVMPPDPSDAGAFAALVKSLEATIESALPEGDRRGWGPPAASRRPGRSADRGRPSPAAERAPDL